MEDKHPLEDLKGICNYKGCEVTKLIGKGYLVFGKKVDSPHQVDEAIERAGEALKESLVYPVTVRSGFNCQQTQGKVDILADKGTGSTIYPCEGI